MMGSKAMNRWRENEEKRLNRPAVSEIEKGQSQDTGNIRSWASGKSTFAQELYQALDSTTVNLLETDPYITSERHLVVPKQALNQKGDSLSASGTWTGKFAERTS